MGQKAASVNLLSFLTLLTVAAAICLASAVGLVFLRPDLIPAALRPPDEPAPVTAAVVVPGPATAAGFPTLPPEWTAAPAATATATGSATSAPPATATNTAVIGGQGVGPLLASATPAGSDAQVAADGNGLRLRAFPGTAGTVIGHLDALTPLVIIGRTPDNVWLEVTTAAGQRGWVLAVFVDVYISLLAVPVTAGAALDASPTALALGEARVAQFGDKLRLRQSPGSAGAILGSLASGTQLDIQGRTANNAWLEVITESRLQGWVMAQFVEVFIDLANIPVTGTPVEGAAPATAAPHTPTPQGVAQVLPSVTTLPPTAVPASATPVPPTAPPPTSPPPANPPPHGGYVDSAYLTGISDHTRAIYLAGLAQGNRANVFSKVGDSITVSPQFLMQFGYGQFNLRDYAGLAEAVNFYAAGWARNGNAFVNTSMAAKGGWSSWSVLSPSLADKSACQANESPLVCEYRLSRPSVALIMLGTNDVMGTTSDAFRANMQRVVADSLQMGVIPVLSTIPHFARSGYETRADELNAIIVSVAQENDVPVWHYWAAMQSLPNRGLGADGVHPSWAPNAADFTPANLAYGSTVRNLTALQALDALWRQVMY